MRLYIRGLWCRLQITSRGKSRRNRDIPTLYNWTVPKKQSAHSEWLMTCVGLWGDQFFRKPTGSYVLDVQVLHIQRIVFDELPPLFYVFTHQRGEDFVGFDDVFEPDPQ